MSKVIIICSLAATLFTCNRQYIDGDVPDNELKYKSVITLKTANHSLTTQEYIDWVDDIDHGLVAIKSVGDYHYTLQHTPIEYILLKEYKTITPAAFQEEKKNRNGLQYFKLQIATRQGNDLLKRGVADANEYEQRLNYLAYQMQHDIQLVDNGDTLNCLLYHFERTYGLTPHRTVLLGFEASTRETYQDKTLIIDDKITQNGIVKLKLKANQLNNIPTLAL